MNCPILEETTEEEIEERELSTLQRQITLILLQQLGVECTQMIHVEKSGVLGALRDGVLQGLQ